jgi:primary-amine oxidase
VVTHHARDMEHGSPAAADGHHATRVRHPLDPLDAGEIRQAVEILQREQPVSPDARFVSVSLNEPPKDQVAFATPDGPAPGQAADGGPDAAVPREAFVVLLEPRQHATYEAVVSLTAESLLSWRLVPDARAPLTAGEYAACQALIRADAQVIAGLARRGITDPAEVHVEPWSIGGPPAGVDPAVPSRAAR